MRMRGSPEVPLKAIDLAGRAKRSIEFRAGKAASRVRRQMTAARARQSLRRATRPPSSSRLRVGAGWTLEPSGGVRHHLEAIRRHSLCDVSILPPADCLRFARAAGTVDELPGVMSAAGLAGFDLVHSHVEPFFVRLCAAAAARGMPWVHTYHTLYFAGHWEGGLAPWQEEINRSLLEEARHAGACISVSRWLQAHLRDVHGIETEYIPNGFDLEKCRAADAARFEDRFGLRDFALFVGAGDDIKDPGTFVRLARLFPRVAFVMIGDRLDRSALLNRAGGEWPANAKVLGLLPHADVLDGMASCRVFVMPSRCEGLPTALMEAMSLGRPVVGCDRFGVREVIGDERFGYLYPHGDLDALRDQFQAAMEDTTRGRAAPGRVASEYDWSRSIGQVDGIYRRLIA